MFDCVYHLSLSLVLLSLLWTVWKYNPISFRFFIVLAGLGVFAAGLLSLADLRLASQGLAWQGSAFLILSALLIGRQSATQQNDNRLRFRLAIFLGMLGIVYFACCVNALLIEPNGLVVKHYVIETEKIDRPIRIALLTDFQTDRIGWYERQTLERLKKQDADLILLGGDYLQSRTERQENRILEDFKRLWQELDLQAPLGIYAVKGNQEYGSWTDWKTYFDGTSIVPIERTLEIDLGEISLVLLSFETSNLRNHLSVKAPNDRFRIILGHSPRFALTRQNADLMLAGHLHGGQVGIPIIGPIWIPVREFPHRWLGKMAELPTGGRLFVSNGTGLERGRAPRVRFFCRPDFAVIDLVPKKDNDMPRPAEADN